LASIRNPAGGQLSFFLLLLSPYLQNIQSTCGSDGKIFIWDLSEKDGKEEKVIEDIIPAVQEE
jgi:hypothetical protein